MLLNLRGKTPMLTGAGKGRGKEVMGMAEPKPEQVRLTLLSHGSG